MKSETRDYKIDIIRGIAILMVIFGHTITTNNLVGVDNSILYKVIFSIQMPLFFLISGYLASASKPIMGYSTFVRIIRKRTATYLFVWFVWSFFVRGLLIDRWVLANILSNAINLLEDPSTGYWFLISIWFISIFWIIADYLSNKLKFNDKTKYFYRFGLFICFIAILIVIGLKVGFNYFAIKYTIYYSAFYLIGASYYHIKEFTNRIKFYQLFSNLTIFLSIVYYGVSVINFNSFLADDSITSIVIRITNSLAGCIILIYAVSAAYNKANNSQKEAIFNYLKIAGVNSLGLYVTHYLFLNTIILENSTNLNSLLGIGISLINFMITMILSSLLVYILMLNKYTRILFFGKN